MQNMHVGMILALVNFPNMFKAVRFVTRIHAVAPSDLSSRYTQNLPSLLFCQGDLCRRTKVNTPRMNNLAPVLQLRNIH